MNMTRHLFLLIALSFLSFFYGAGFLYTSRHMEPSGEGTVL